MNIENIIIIININTNVDSSWWTQAGTRVHFTVPEMPVVSQRTVLGKNVICFCQIFCVAVTHSSQYRSPPCERIPKM